MLSDRLFDARNRLLSSARFRNLAEKIPGFQWVARRRARDLFALAGGFIHSQVLLACVRLDLFARLAAGPQGDAELAKSLDVPVESLSHLLRAAAALRLLERRADGRTGLGVLGAAMVDNPSLAALIDHHEYLYRDLADPVALFSGRETAGRMRSLWPYATSDESSAGAASGVETYTELMAASQSMVAAQVVAAYDFGRHRTLADIGGGKGAFARAIHGRWPELRITVVDLPPVAALASDDLSADGLDGAITVVGADATRDPLPGPFDVVTLVRILHDHDDEMVRSLLSAAKRALAPGGSLVVAEPLADAPGAGRLIDAYFNVYLHAMGSGRPRRFSDLKAFLEAAGFERVRLRRTRVPLVTSVISADRP